ncbi:hypothetical protein Cst_c25160 [Thermoclostridium stercorarium subsp. stercorarium DSM 8532]|uniref:Uncharacterized protein n=1 Tax=Thermoclostridium stercorarium (strain ATCC 35414 / DSM 8532 / NCIMB 11754) TaxID=1121335 RepID=L7VV56_THES1|nr:hypothetical protein Cst_c25160 [Thermoclostridium stercorarium subsp. stercorarium DSM 8532]
MTGFTRQRNFPPCYIGSNMEKQVLPNGKPAFVPFSIL